MRSWAYSGFSVDNSVYREGRFLFKWGEYDIEKGSIFRRPILNVRTFRPLPARLLLSDLDPIVLRDVGQTVEYRLVT